MKSNLAIDIRRDLVAKDMFESKSSYLKRMKIKQEWPSEKFESLMVLSKETKESLRHIVADYQEEFIDAYDKRLISLATIRRLIALFAVFLIIFFFVYLLASYIVYLLYPSFVVNNSNVGFYSIISLTGFLLIMTLVDMVLSKAAFDNLKQHVIYSIVRGIVSLIYSIERNPDFWIKCDYRQKLMQEIETIARYFEIDLPYQLQSGDKATDEWFKVTTKEVADALREKKKWILTPSKLTRDDLLRSLSATLISVLEGDWDALERDKTKSRVRLSIWYTLTSSLFKTLKTFFIALFPLSSLIVLQRTTGAIPETAFPTVITLTILYGVSVLLSASNPAFNDRISNVSGLMQLFPGTGAKL